MKTLISLELKTLFSSIFIEAVHQNFKIYINSLNNDSQEIIINMLTLAPRMSYRNYKENLIYLHQFTKIYMLDNGQLYKIQKIILFYMNCTFLATLIYLFDFVLPYKFLTLIVSIFASLVLQIATKYLRVSLQDPKYFRQQAIFSQSPLHQDNLLLWHSFKGNINMVNAIVEPIIQYFRLNFMHQIHPIIKENKMDAQIHFIYYFLQDEYILYIVQQRER
ncbi:hypothetical protein pb186bvf_017417 [Paramecium bursaria]